VPGDMRIVDIAFLPQWCNRGIGGALIAAVQAQARQRGDKVSIHVERENPARRLYQRLGFQPVKPAGIYDLLEWPLGA
jgi:ribosomal protein S18 acetylase RimI-like enzyme